MHGRECVVLLCRAAHSDAVGDVQTTSLAKALAASGSGNGDSLPELASTSGNGGGGNGGTAEAVATPRTPTRDGEDGSLASIMTAQRDRFRQRCCNPVNVQRLLSTDRQQHAPVLFDGIASGAACYHLHDVKLTDHGVTNLCTPRVLRLEEDLGVAQAETTRLQAELAASQKDNLDMVAKVSCSSPVSV